MSQEEYTLYSSISNPLQTNSNNVLTFSGVGAVTNILEYLQRSSSHIRTYKEKKGRGDFREIISMGKIKKYAKRFKLARLCNNPMDKIKELVTK